MKLYKTIIALLITSLISGCCKCDLPESDSDFHLDSKYLNQTVWEGSFIEHIVEEKPTISNINIFFKTTSEAIVRIKYEIIENPSIYNVKYRAEKNMLSIELNAIESIYGNWLVIEKSEDKLSLGKNLVNGEWMYKMLLERKY